LGSAVRRLPAVVFLPIRRTIGGLVSASFLDVFSNRLVVFTKPLGRKFQPATHSLRSEREVDGASELIGD